MTGFDLQAGMKCKVLAAGALYDGIVTADARGNPPSIQVHTPAAQVLSKTWQSILFHAGSLEGLCCTARLIILEDGKPEPVLSNFIAPGDPLPESFTSPEWWGTKTVWKEQPKQQRLPYADSEL